MDIKVSAKDQNKAKRNLESEDEDSSNEENELSEEEQIEYYEESSESEPELECDVWDVGCKILETRANSFVNTNVPSSSNPTNKPNQHKKHKLSVEINNKLTSQDLLNQIRESFKNNTGLINENLELIVNPFKVFVINNFLDNEDLLSSVRREFNDLDWNNRNMDLYEFFQSKDLKYLNTEYIKCIYEFLKTDVMSWVSSLTGFDLTHISATCSLYSNTDYLLVHDDQREDRLVAFVLYLTGPEGWNKNKGGALQLLNKDEKGQPLEVVKEIFPSNNQLVLFPVTSDSYHQVAEVTSLSDCRLSINGWFHTKIPPEYRIPPYDPSDSALFGDKYSPPREVDIDLHSWVCEDYLEEQSIKLIQHHIEENSEISLKNFFKQESFNEILKTLRGNEVSWRRIGPPNRYSYEVLTLQNLPHILERCINLFHSTEMFSLLQRYTDLELTGSSAAMKFEIQKWTPGSYSLLTDYNWQSKNELDLIMYFGCKNSSNVIGARTQYVTIEDEIQNALITLEPEENNLNIVYRDSARFTKYFSKQSQCQVFYKLICSYCE